MEVSICGIFVTAWWPIKGPAVLAQAVRRVFAPQSRCRTIPSLLRCSTVQSRRAGFHCRTARQRLVQRQHAVAHSIKLIVKDSKSVDNHFGSKSLSGLRSLLSNLPHCQLRAACHHLLRGNGAWGAACHFAQAAVQKERQPQQAVSKQLQQEQQPQQEQLMQQAVSKQP